MTVCNPPPCRVRPDAPASPLVPEERECGVGHPRAIGGHPANRAQGAQLYHNINAGPAYRDFPLDHGTTTFNRAKSALLGYKPRG